MRGLVFIVCAYTVLAVTWIFSNPPHAAPDEGSHFLRAVSIGHGQLIGDPIKNSDTPHLIPRGTLSEGVYRAEVKWAAENTRSVKIPAGLNPPWSNCSLDPLVVPPCLSDTDAKSKPARRLIPTGNYQPFPYLATAPITRLRVDPNWLDRYMRIVKATIALVLIAIALIVLWVPGQFLLSALGLVVALTPMVVFLTASLNPSGLEISAAIAFFACLLRLGRGTGKPWVWLALGTSGSIVALSRAPAPLWLVLDASVFFLLTGATAGVSIVRSGRRYALVASGMLVGAIALNRLWEHFYGPHFVLDPTPLGSALRTGWTELPSVLAQQIGIFDYLEIGMTPLAYTAWFCMIAALLAVALLLGSRRERLVLIAIFFSCLALPILLVAAIMRHTGFDLQGRYVLPFSTVMPLLAGEIVYRRRAALAQLNAKRLFIPFAVVAALVHLAALYANARRFAVGMAGPAWFIGGAVWSPPGGWWLWLLTALLGAALLAFALPFDVGISRTRMASRRTAAASRVSR